MSEQVFIILSSVTIVGFGVLLIALLAYAADHTIARIARAEFFRAFAFRRIFGIWPAKQEPEKRICQGVIERVLSQRAISFDAACQEERRLLGRLRDFSMIDLDLTSLPNLKQGLKKIAATRQDLARAQRRLAKSKSAFWEVHALAKKFNFVVENQYTDHLSN